MRACVCDRVSGCCQKHVRVCVCVCAVCVGVSECILQTGHGHGHGNDHWLFGFCLGLCHTATYNAHCLCHSPCRVAEFHFHHATTEHGGTQRTHGVHGAGINNARHCTQPHLLCVLPQSGRPLVRGASCELQPSSTCNTFHTPQRCMWQAR